MRFRDEFEAYLGGPAEVTVEVKGPAFVGPYVPPAPEKEEATVDA